MPCALLLFPGADGRNELVRHHAAVGGVVDPTGAVSTQQSGGHTGHCRLHRIPVSTDTPACRFLFHSQHVVLPKVTSRLSSTKCQQLFQRLGAVG